MSIDRLIGEIGNVPNSVWAAAMKAFMQGYELHKEVSGSYKELEGLKYQIGMRERREYQLQCAFTVTRKYWDQQDIVREHIELRTGE